MFGLGQGPNHGLMDPSIHYSKDEFEYSDKFADDLFEYRYVVVPRPMLHHIPVNRVMQEEEWRRFGITQSLGWEHYDRHYSEHNVLLFRRPRATDPKTGKTDPAVMKAIQQRHERAQQIEQRYRDFALANEFQEQDQALTDL